MQFTAEDSYLPLPTLTTLNLKVLHVAKKEIHRLTAAHCCELQHIFDFSRQNYHLYYLQVKCMLVCCRFPLSLIHLIVLVLSVFFIRNISTVNVPSFLRKHITQACSAMNLPISVFLRRLLSQGYNRIRL